MIVFRRASLTAFISILIPLASTALAETQQKKHFKSAEAATQLIELYTSQGCSSCPPAHRWMNALASEQGLWNTFVPVSFHVDYWDYLGWDDLYSKAAYSQRQRQHYTMKNISQVYTPGFVIQGQEWRGFFRQHPKPMPKSSKPGIINLTWQGQNGSLTFKPNQSFEAKAQYCNIALLGFDKMIDIGSGENKGLALEHNFTVLEMDTLPLQKNDNGNLTCQTNLDAVDDHKLGIAAWVSDKKMNPIQATGGWL